MSAPDWLASSLDYDAANRAESRRIIGLLDQPGKSVGESLSALAAAFCIANERRAWARDLAATMRAHGVERLSDMTSDQETPV